MATTATRKKAAPKKEPEYSEVVDESTGKKLTIQQLKNRLRNEAEREVLDAHKDEVHERTGAKYTAHGLEYIRRLTDAEKAAKAIEEHLAAHPELRAQFGMQVESVEYDDEPDGRGDYGMDSLADQG